MHRNAKTTPTTRSRADAFVNGTTRVGTGCAPDAARTWAGLLFLFLITVFAGAPRGAAAQSSSIPGDAAYQCDFENSWCEFSEQSALGDVPSGTARRSSIVSPGRNGSTAVRLHTESGDNSVHGSGTWERDDLTLGPSGSYCNEGQEEWWAVSVMFPSDYVYPPGPEGGVVLDFHHNADNGLPNMSIDTMPGTGMRQRGYGGATVNGGQYSAQIADPYGAVGDVTRNKWYDFVFHVKWSSSSNGYMEAWLNGKKFQMYNGATLYSGISCYLKLANYHAAFGQASSIIFDRVIRGTSADVAIEPLEGVASGISSFTQVSSSSSYNNPSAPGTTTTTTPTSPATTPASSGGSGGSSGSSGNGTTSATMDSSAYTIAAGQSVTFKAAVMGNSGTPGGTIAFRSDGNTIAECASVALSGGTASCTTSSLPAGAHAITGVYSGDATYGAAQAGPITETVTGSSAQSATLPAKFGMDSSSYTSAPGQSVTFTATIPGSGGSVDFQDNGSAISGCSGIGVSSSGLAYCTTSSLAAGAHAVSAVYSGSGSYAAGIAGPITQTVSASAPGVAPPAAGGAAMNVQGLWWGGASESGWGLNLTQQGEIVFATWFTYDANGKGEWLVMSDGQHSGNTYSGTLYRTTGPAYSDPAFDPSRVARTPVGSMTLVFSDAGNGTMSATVDGVNVTKTITRQSFGPMPTCTAGGGASGTPNFQDLWWRPNGVESGWGLNIAHEGDVLFATWFTYDVDGSDMWLVGSDIAKQADGTYAGTLYRTSGPAFNTSPWNASQVTRTAVGTMTVTFNDLNSGVFSYTVNGVTQSKPITREAFSTPPTVCH